MIKIFFSIIITVLFLLGQPLTVFAQVDRWHGYENSPAGGIGFFQYPAGAVPGQKEAFLLRGAGGDLWVTGDAIWLTQYEERSFTHKGDRQEFQPLRGVNIKVSFPGANKGATLVAGQPMPGHVSILKGENPEGWAEALPLWGLLRYRNLYPGVDFVIRSTEWGFDWHFEVQEGANKGALRLWVKGADGIRQDAAGTVLGTPVGDVRLPALGLEGRDGFEESNGTTRRLNGELFEVYPQVIRSEPLAADPDEKLTYSTYLGGTAREEGYDVAVDANGDVYLAGATTSTDFPVTIGDTTLDNMDAFIAKFNMAETPPTLAYATYLGGNGIERAYSLGVENGIAYVTGETDSSDFPLAGDAADVDAFAVALNETGSGLNYARLIGGSEPEDSADDYGYAIAIENGKVFLTGITYSPDFPTTNESSYTNRGDVFIHKLNSDGTTAYSTILGGKYVDAGYGIDVKNGIAWLTGETDSDDFIERVSDSAVFVISITGIGLMDSARVFDGILYERGFDLALDSAGDIYVTGFTKSADFPVSEGVYNGGLNDAFLLKLSPSSTIYAAYLGGTGSDHGLGIAVDAIGGVVVIGDTYSTDFPVTDDAFQALNGGGGDGFITRYFLAGDALGYRSYSSYLGGTDLDSPSAVAMDDEVSAYITGHTKSIDFPVTLDGLYQTLKGTQDAFLSVMAVAPLPTVQIEKFTNSLDADTAPGEYYLPGTPITWTYDVTNNGEVALESVVVTDSKGVAVDCGGVTTLESSQSIQCTASGDAESDQYGNLGIVTAVDSAYGIEVSDADASHYFGAVPDTTLVKLTNDVDANSSPGVYIQEEDNVTWTYEVTNNGNVDLTNVTVIDDNGTPESSEDDIIICNIPLLQVGESDTTSCQLLGTALPGQYSNIAVVTGTPPGGLENVSDDDVSHYFGSAPAITMLKKTNGIHSDSTPGSYLLVDTPITWTYELENTGNVTLTNVTVVDDNGTEETSDDIVVCSGLTIDPLATHTCSLESTAEPGQYYNIATLTAEPPVGTLTPFQDQGYYFGADPAVEIEFSVNDDAADSEPGLHVLAGMEITLKYSVTNTGNVPLTGLIVSDSLGNSCNIDSLDVGATDDATCTRVITAQSGTQSVYTSVTATPPGGLSDIASETDYIYYFGSQPGLSLVKKTNDQIVESEPGVYVLTGSTVTWTYELENTGNVTLTDVFVIDDNGTSSNPDDDYTVCSGITLAPMSTHICSWEKSAQEGQYTNIAVAFGNPPSPLSAVDVSDNSYYYGTTLNVTLDKQTNGEDAQEAPGPLIAVGDAVNWTYSVTNNSNISVDIAVVDDQGVSITCPINTLGISENTICTGSGTAVAGQYSNTATVTISPPGGLSPIDIQDTSHYYGVLTGIDIEKFTNGQDADESTGPYIKFGDPVNWTYEVTNTGNVILSGINITDDKGVMVSCPYDSLDVGASMTCTASGTAFEGQYSNLGSVTGDPPMGFSQVSDSDPSHYYGSIAGIDIEKFTKGEDVSAPPGPYILVGEDVTWTFRIENTGNLNLENISVVDDNGTPENTEDDIYVCTISNLASGVVDTTSCSAIGTVTAGLYTNIAYVSAEVPNLGGEIVNDQDASYYFGAAPSITIEKSTNGQDADEPPGPYIPVGETVTNQFEIINPESQYKFTDILVSDDSGVTVSCPATTLEPGDAPMICTANGSAAIGQQTFTGHVNAKAILISNEQELGFVSASDVSNYYGYTLSLDLLKRTNGQLVEEPPGPEFTIGSLVTWTYEVTNVSNVHLSSIEVSDDKESQVTCPSSELAPTLSMICEVNGTIKDGAYANKAQASGRYDETEEIVWSPEVFSYYTGVPGFILFLPYIMR